MIAMVVLLFCLNFFISWANAWGVGKTWNETKHNGGMPHFLNWMAAIMSASGFIWCNLVIIGVVASVVPIETDPGVYVTILNPEQLKAFFDLGYLVIIFPILGSGLAITIHSWGVFYRRRTLGNGAVAGWNTFANVYNVANAISYVPEASKGVFALFKGDGDKKGALIFGLVLLAVFGGVLMTVFIIKRTARSTARQRAIAYKAQANAER